MNDRYAHLEDHERALALLDELGTVLGRMTMTVPEWSKPYTLGDLMDKNLRFIDVAVRQRAVFNNVPGWQMWVGGRVLAPGESGSASEFMRQVTS